MTQQGNIEEPLDDFKSYHTPSKENSEKDRLSEEKEDPNEGIIHGSNDNLSKESLAVKRNNSIHTDSEPNKDALLNEIREIRKEVHILAEKISKPIEKIAKFFETYQNHFLSTSHNPNIDQISNKNQDLKQSEVVLHKIEDYKKVRDKYPYEVFTRDELPNLDSISKKEYQRYYKLAEQIEPLAFYLYRNPLLTEQTMKSFLKTYKEYSKEYEEFDLKKLKSIYIEKDLMESESQETLSKKWRQWRQIWTISYGVSKDSFPQIKFSSEKKVKEQERSVVDKGIIKYAWETLSKNGKHAESLMIYLMFAFELTPRDVRLLKFEDIKMKNKQGTITVYRSKNNSWQQIPITESLYKRIIKNQNDLTKNGKCFMANRSTKEETIVGHFLFKDSKSSIIKKFRTKFWGLLKDFDICSKDLRISSLNDKNSEGSPKESKRFEEKKMPFKPKGILKGTSKNLNQPKKLRKSKKH